MRAARHSVVRVFGTACGLGVEGSGWVAAPGLVVTNAHVVAGETDTAIQIDGVGPGHAAHALVFDPHNDIAILRVPGLALRPLAIAAHADSGTAAAILGYPLDGAFDAEPGRLGQTETVDTQNAYGQGHVQRSITALRGKVRPGQLRRPDGRRARPGRGDRVRRAHAAGRLRGPSARGIAVPEASACGRGLSNSAAVRARRRRGSTGSAATGWDRGQLGPHEVQP